MCVCVCVYVCVCICVCVPVQHKTHISLGSDMSVRRTTVQADFTSKTPQFVRNLKHMHVSHAHSQDSCMQFLHYTHCMYVCMCVFVCVCMCGLPCAEGTGGSHKYP